MDLVTYLLHHSESIDPTLLDWIRHEIDAVLGLGPATIVAILGTLIVAFPVALYLAARRQMNHEQQTHQTTGRTDADERTRARRAWRQG